MKNILIATIICFFAFSSCKKEEGCTDISAENFDINATIDNGSCIYNLTKEGCTDMSADNFDPSATIDNGSCIYNLTINFTHTVDGVLLEKDTMIYFNSSGQNFSVQNLRYIISEITLYSENQNNTLIDEVHYITISDISTFNINIQNLNSTNYTAISFEMGLDSTKNQLNYYLNEDFHLNFGWPNFMPLGTGGYHYMQLEGAYDNISQGYLTHTGPTGGKDFSFSNEFILDLDMTTTNTSVTINMEINNWYSNPNAISLTSDGIMGDENKQQLLKENGMANVFSVNIN